MAQEKLSPEDFDCDRCGKTCTLGYEIRSSGRRDFETGYQDEGIVCVDCIEAEELDREDDMRYACGDDAFTMAYEEGEI